MLVAVLNAAALMVIKGGGVTRMLMSVNRERIFVTMEYVSINLVVTIVSVGLDLLARTVIWTSMNAYLDPVKTMPYVKIS